MVCLYFYSLLWSFSSSLSTVIRLHQKNVKISWYDEIIYTSVYVLTLLSSLTSLVTLFSVCMSVCFSVCVYEHAYVTYVNINFKMHIVGDDYDICKLVRHFISYVRSRQTRWQRSKRKYS